MSLKIQKSSWCQTRSFPLLPSIHGVNLLHATQSPVPCSLPSPAILQPLASKDNWLVLHTSPFAPLSCVFGATSWTESIKPNPKVVSSCVASSLGVEKTVPPSFVGLDHSCIPRRAADSRERDMDVEFSVRWSTLRCVPTA